MSAPVKAVIDRCMAGDETACEEFYARYDRLATNVLRHVFPRMSRADRADTASAALERLLGAIRSNRIAGVSDGEIKAYMSSAVRNAGLDLVARQRNVAWDGIGDDAAARWPDGASPERVAISRTLVEKVLGMLSSWASQDRYIFLQKFHGVPSARIRADLAQPPFNLLIEVATIDTRYWRLRQLVMRELGEEAGAA
jgi:hypothetical protein